MRATKCTRFPWIETGRTDSVFVNDGLLLTFTIVGTKATEDIRKIQNLFLPAMGIEIPSLPQRQWGYLTRSHIASTPHK